MVRILFVDDEPHVLSALRRTLRSMRKEWEMAFETRATKALDAMENGPYHIIVSDLQMPDMDGVEFLETVRLQYPETVRMALSGQTDTMANFRAVGPVHLFLFKPCEPEMLKAALMRAVRLSELLKDPKLKGLISKMKTVPSLPMALTEMLEEIEKPDTSTDTVGTLVARDVSMSAKVLHLVNSSFFGLPYRVVSPREATILLGLDTMRTLILSAGVFEQFDQEIVDQLMLEDLRGHSIEVARVAEVIAAEETGDGELGPHVLTAGLLHDVGKLVFASCIPREYGAVVRLCSDHPTSQTRVEEKIIGSSHARVGGYLLGLWGLSEPIVEAISFHHRPRESHGGRFAPLTAVHSANCIVQSRHCGGKLATMDLLDTSYLQSLGLIDRVPVWQKTCSQVFQQDYEH